MQKQIIDYFAFFEEFYNTSKTCLKDCQNCAASINKLIKRCNSIKEAEVVGTPLEEFENLQAKLCASIHNLISEEVQEIRNKLTTIEELFEKLVNKNRALRESCREINFKEDTPLVKGTPLQPPLKQLLEFADDTITFGSQICAQIDTSLSVLSFKTLHTESFADNFRIPTEWQQKVPEIIAYTSFISENHGST